MISWKGSQLYFLLRREGKTILLFYSVFCLQYWGLLSNYRAMDWLAFTWVWEGYKRDASEHEIESGREPMLVVTVGNGRENRGRWRETYAPGVRRSGVALPVGKYCMSPSIIFASTVPSMTGLAMNLTCTFSSPLLPGSFLSEHELKLIPSSETSITNNIDFFICP